VFNHHHTTAWSEPFRKSALPRLYALDAATNRLDLPSPPSNRLEKLRGNRAGQYGIRVNEQWRICFEWHGRDVWSVEIVDYH
jgi:toxin HigB-1